jgi:mRNA-degrading endonuclease toxin of MazEF toxin-antitoxin module
MWVDHPLWLVRPKNTARLDEAALVPVASVSDAFRGDRGEETVVAMAKARPAIVISPAAELRRGDTYRVAPIYSYNPGSFWDRRRSDLQAGHIPYAIHLNAGAGLHAGVVRLDQVAVIPRGAVTESGGGVIGALHAPSLAVLLDHYSRFVAIFDQSEVVPQP